MSEKIITDIVSIDKSTNNIEHELSRIINGEIIRWAVVGIEQNNLKICCSYKK